MQLVAGHHHTCVLQFLLCSTQRLKEQGWNVDRTERKMLMCGVAGLPAGSAAAAGADGLQDLLAGAWLFALLLLLRCAWRWLRCSDRACCGHVAVRHSNRCSSTPSFMGKAVSPCPAVLLGQIMSQMFLPSVKTTALLRNWCYNSM
jgi:hypothetical protein